MADTKTKTGAKAPANAAAKTPAEISGLMNAIYAEFTEKIAPALPPEHKYSAAMMKRGLEILAAYVNPDANPDARTDASRDESTDGFSFARHGHYSDAQLAKALRDRDPGLPGADELHKQLADNVQSRRRQANPNATLPSVKTL